MHLDGFSTLWENSELGFLYTAAGFLFQVLGFKCVSKLGR
jgi:hypothetical protein